MNTAARAVAAVVLIAGLAGAFALLRGGGGAGPPEPKTAERRFTSSQECRACHARVFDEWYGSHHQIAYTNPEVRKLSEDFRNKECQACHLPRLVYETGLGGRPLPRQTRPDEGVDCLTCHQNTEGRIVARRDVPTAGCAPVRDEGLLSIDLCKSCHNQHFTTDQYLASEYPKRGIHCNDCHMPEAPREGGGKGRNHVFPGAHDAEMLRRAVELRTRRDGDDMVVEVENTGAGHNFPTEERHRCGDVLYRFVTKGQEAAPEPAFTRLYRFRQPYLGDPAPNTQLPAHQTWSGRIPLTDAPKGGVLQVRVIYKLTPLDTDLGTVLHEHALELP